MTADIDRAWSRRALVSPPPWGRSVPDIWAETSVSFSRTESTQNSLGGFSETSPVTVGPVISSVSIDTEVPTRAGSDELRGAAAAGPVRRRTYLVIIDPAQFADWPGYHPRKGDLMTFQDPRWAPGDTVTAVVASATMPNGIGDHWEVESEAFE